MFDFVTDYYVQASLRFDQLKEDSRGVTAIEYALIGVAMATFLAVVLGDQNSGFLGDLQKAFTKISDSIQKVTMSSKA